ncbi:MAG: hypothetical protein LKF87_11235 [Clostridium tyrobutyricum]|uniref:type II secretion system F family protein n=2 Tax=Clostridium tyrobutyricum TaxID=1519 RepID=UPI0011CC8008|nr:hypothetical protein [Clostridium tyrobutyricum]MCH4236467.1 hypothetical protein [Clostridium tyrobutyricum]MCH4259513.1 hypothetical protein [Clostridium tyrobutyricum]
MINHILLLVLSIIMFLLIYNSIYILILYIRNSKISKKINEGLNNPDIKKLKKNMQYVSKKKHIKYIENLAILIQQSGINVKYKFITPYFIIFISCLIGFLFFFLAQHTVKILITSILIAFIGYKIPSVLLNILIAVNANQITHKLIDFMNILKNFCMVKNDIVYAIKATGEYMKEPLNAICKNFRYEVDHGITPYEALENIKYKIDNKQYSIFIKNLQICSKGSNQYLEVITKSEKLMKRIAKEQLLRRKEINRGLMGVGMLIIMSMIIILMLIYMNPDLITALQSSFIGKSIVTANAFAYFIAVLVIEKLSQFDF